MQGFHRINGINWLNDSGPVTDLARTIPSQHLPFLVNSLLIGKS